MTTLLDLIETPPSEWIDLPGGRRLAVSIVAPELEGMVLGQMVLGAGKLSGLRWLSIVDGVRGIDSYRGSRDGSNNVGTLTLTLDNRTGRFSPWASPSVAAGGTPSRFRPRTLLRVAAYTPALGWRSVFTGVVESWEPDKTATGRDAWVTVTAVETVSLLARIDKAEQPPNVSTGSLIARYNYLLADANWQFGSSYDPGGFTDNFLQPTTLAGNRLAECYLTAASFIYPSVFRSDRDGRAQQVRRSTLATLALDDLTHDVAGTKYVPGTLLTANDDALIVNVVQLARVGGTVQTFTNESSRAQFDDRTYRRFDLLPELWVGNPFNLIAADLLGRGATTLRPTRCEVTNLHGTAQLDWMIAADVGAVIDVTDPAVTFHDVQVAALRHRITPRHGADVVWNCTVSFIPSATSTWEPTT